MQDAGIPCAPIHDVAEALNMAQVKHRNMIVEFEGSPIKVLGSPLKLSDTPVQYHTSPPKLGADTVAVLQAIGIDNTEIDALQACGVV